MRWFILMSTTEHGTWQRALTGEHVRVVFVKGGDGSDTLDGSGADDEGLHHFSHGRCIQHTHLGRGLGYNATLMM